MPSTVCNQKKSFFTRWFWDVNHLYPCEYKIFNKIFLYILKPLETFLARNYFYSNAKKYKWDEKSRFDLTTDSLIEKYETISIKIKIRISQFIVKILLKQRSLNQVRNCLTVHIQTDIIFLSKNIKVFQWLSESEFLSFMTKENPSNGNEIKSDIFPWDIFKFDTISFFVKKH